MAKLLNLMLLVVAVQIALFLIVGQSVPGSSLWTFLISPSGWSDTDIMALLFDTIAIAGVGLIVVGTFVYRSDFVTFAGITSVFLSFGSSLYNLWLYVQSQSLFGGASSWIATIIISPIILMYVYVALEFWRGKD